MSLKYFKRRGQGIYSLATAPGGPVAVFRVSGIDLSRLWKLLGKALEPGTFELREIKDHKGEAIDKALVLFFKAPHSFTGEDVVEIQGHGVPAIVEKISSQIKALGFLEALPGEFSFRAYANGKATLNELEGLNESFLAESLPADKASSLICRKNSDIAIHLKAAKDAVVRARGRVEAAIDFPEAEEEQGHELRSAKDLLDAALGKLYQLKNSYDVYSKSRERARVLLMGAPNAGKSTLLNRLLGAERSLVSAMAGTTRDYVEVYYRGPSGRQVRLVDTAGLRELGSHSGPALGVESEGIEKALSLIEQAALVLWVHKGAEKLSQTAREVLVKLKADAADDRGPKLLEIYSHKDSMSEAELCGRRAEYGFDFRSMSDSDLGLLQKCIEQGLVDSAQGECFEEALMSERQGKLLEQVVSELSLASELLESEAALEIVALHLQSAESFLREAVAEDLSDEYIESIFSQFCLGK